MLKNIFLRHRNFNVYFRASHMKINFNIMFFYATHQVMIKCFQHLQCESIMCITNFIFLVTDIDQTHECILKNELVNAS